MDAFYLHLETRGQFTIVVGTDFIKRGKDELSFKNSKLFVQLSSVTYIETEHIDARY